MSSNLTNNHRCKNCDFQMGNYSFCPNCGAKKITKRITFKNLAQDFSDRFLNLDNSFIRTFIHLFTKPKNVIDGYIYGLRKRYINVFSYFAISLTIASLYSFILGKYKDKIFAKSMISAEQAEATKVTTDFSFEYQSVISFLTIPLLALISRLVFLNYKKYNLTEHFVIYLYSYSHITMIVSIITMPFLLSAESIFVIIGFQMFIYITYTGYVLKKLYEINFKKILIKTLLFLIIISVIFIIFSFIIGLIMIKMGLITNGKTPTI